MKIFVTGGCGFIGSAFLYVHVESALMKFLTMMR